jgi:hypothetical protein
VATASSVAPPLLRQMDGVGLHANEQQRLFSINITGGARGLKRNAITILDDQAIPSFGADPALWLSEFVHVVIVQDQYRLQVNKQKIGRGVMESCAGKARNGLS